ncbi:MAG TPA: 3-(methylthio)propionyl-CoA ligase [Azospirillaceae bacterium]|nr:3-(methylthio)propionyl-CoA ligase [Azospirillaceae bacterium]
MRGLMMDMPLLISSILEHGALYHADSEIVSRTVEGPIHRYTLGDAARRVRKLANALDSLGVKLGDRVATLAWNGYRHFEAYYAVSGLGAVLHTINPRLFPAQIAYIVNHAEDQYILVDLTFVPLLEALADQLKTVKGYVILTDRAHMPATKLPNAICYEDLIEGQSDAIAWPEFDERTASSLCYTSGTTGNPKGVLYSHRSTVLHSITIVQPDVMNLSSRDCMLPVVPMFHVNAWGIAYAQPMVGCKLVLPGPKLDGASLHELMETEEVTVSAGVPTVWLGLLNHVAAIDGRFTHLKRTIIGGSAAPPAMIRTFQEKYGVDVLHAWGMTEMSPLGTLNTLKRNMLRLPDEEKFRVRCNQGRVIYGVQLRITDDQNKELPRDGKAFGHLQVRGPWIASEYFRDGKTGTFTEDGWFDTGDVATLDPNGYMQITDRAKDVIKSGGEWISSIDLENIAVAHPDVVEAAAIGVHHPKWDERPLLVIVRKPDSNLTREEMLAFFQGKVAKWWMPDDVVFVEELPHTATGKLSKLKIREQFKDYRLPDVA